MLVNALSCWKVVVVVVVVVAPSSVLRVGGTEAPLGINRTDSLVVVAPSSLPCGGDP